MLLLLTGTIDPSVFSNTNVAITAADERLCQYVDSIKKYIETDIFSSIVFVENSGYAFPIEEISALAENHNVKFEFIQIETDVEKTIVLGKSYGEADCIEKGLLRSELAKDEKVFVKCTGRVFVANIKKLCAKHQNSNKFLFRDDMNYCYTLIFQMIIEEYKKYFFRCKEYINEAEGVDIEKSFYRIITEEKIKFKNYRSYPFIDGLCGTTGTSYNEQYRMKSFFTKVGLFSHNRFNKTIYRVFAPKFLELKNKLHK